MLEALVVLALTVGVVIALAKKPRWKALVFIFGFAVALVANITWEFAFPPWFVAVAASLLVLPSAVWFATHTDTTEFDFRSVSDTINIGTSADRIWNRMGATSTATR